MAQFSVDDHLSLLIFYHQVKAAFKDQLAPGFFRRICLLQVCSGCMDSPENCTHKKL